MQRNIEKYLWDMLEACQRIQEHTAGLSFEEYKSSDLITSTVERKFEIIGEALRRIQELDPGIAAQVEHSREIIRFRNRLIHGYDLIDYPVVWTVIKEDLPVLMQSLQALLASN